VAEARKPAPAKVTPPPGVPTPSTPAPAEPPPGVPAPSTPEPGAPDDDLKALFRTIWDLTSDIATLETRLSVANRKQQELLSKAYDMVGGALMQTEEGKTFRLRPVGGNRTFVFIWEHTPAKIIKV
jgi:hypothetical protein